jgi:hypothetical protein
MFEASDYARERYNEMVERGLMLARLARVREGEERAVPVTRLGWLRALVVRRLRGQGTRLEVPSAATSPSA